MNILESLFHRKDRVPGYTLLYPLARGTMSTVYYAVNETEHPFAIKIINKESSKIVNKLNRVFRNGKTEGEVARKFDHPSIVKTYDCGVEHNKEYIVEEYVKGMLLSDDFPRRYDEYRKNPFPLLLAMAEALNHIHSKGYIHRDFCPQNIFVCEAETFKLFDFGLTISITAAQRIRGNRTGRLSYLAPELLKRELTDQRTDIYAFGVLMYELFTLRRPYTGKTHLERMLHIMNSAPRDPREINPEIPEEWYTILVKAMHRNKNMRYHTFDDVINDLREAKESLNL